MRAHGIRYGLAWVAGVAAVVMINMLPAAVPPARAAQPDSPAGAPAASTAAVSDLLNRAAASYPSLATARHARRQAEFRAVAAGALLPVTLNVGRGFGEDASGDDEDIFLTGRYELGDRRKLRAQGARLEVEAARAREAQALADLASLVRSGAALLQGAVAEEDVTRQNVELARNFRTTAAAQFEAGAVPQTDVLRSEVELENAEQALVATQAAAAAARIRLNTLVGADPSAPMVLPPLALVSIEEMDLAALRARALRRPDVRAAEATLQARRAAVASAREGRKPDLTVDAAHAHLDELHGNVLRLGVAFPLFDFGVTKALTNAARAAEREQSALVELARLQAAQEVEVAYTNYVAARAQAERLGGPQLERARRLVELAQLGYKEGEFGYLQLLDAQRSYLTTYTLYVRAVANANAAAADLLRAIGAGVDGISRPPAGGQAPGSSENE